MVARVKGGDYIMIRGSFLHEDVTIINIYASSIRELKYVKQILADMKLEIDVITVNKCNNFNTPL